MKYKCVIRTFLKALQILYINESNIQWKVKIKISLETKRLLVVFNFICYYFFSKLLYFRLFKLQRRRVKSFCFWWKLFFTKCLIFHWGIQTSTDYSSLSYYLLMRYRKKFDYIRNAILKSKSSPPHQLSRKCCRTPINSRKPL